MCFPCDRVRSKAWFATRVLLRLVRMPRPARANRRSTCCAPLLFVRSLSIHVTWRKHTVFAATNKEGERTMTTACDRRVAMDYQAAAGEAEGSVVALRAFRAVYASPTFRARASTIYYVESAI